MKWVMCNSGHGGAQRPKVYFGYNLSLEVWGSKGEWRFGLSHIGYGRSSAFTVMVILILNQKPRKRQKDGSQNGS